MGHAACVAAAVSARGRLAAGVEITVAGERVRLHPERALIWRDTAYVADVHWGKSATFRRAGVPVPDGELDEDLHRLGVLAKTVRRIVVLGDLVHAAVPPSVAERVGAWREQVRIPFGLVRGNHDRHQADLPAAWAVEELGPVTHEGPFCFRHEPAEEAGFTWAGHVHPGVLVGAGNDWLRLPCFHIGPRVGILPAFGRFTGSVRVPVRQGERAYAIVDGEIVDLGA